LRVLITGHKGYIGSVLVPMAQQQGHEVVGLDSGLFEDCIFGQVAETGVPWIRKDLREVQASDLEGFDAILHLAGISNDPLGDLNPECTYEINHLASVRLAKLAKEAGVSRFIFSSSCSNYGAAGDNFLNEGSAFNPVTPYGVSKVRVEQDVHKMASDKFSPTFLRSATAYGISTCLRADLVLNNLVGWAFTTGLVYLKSDGTPWRPIVHIEDISRAFLAVMEAPRELVHLEAFNVGITEENYRISELAEIVKETVPGCRVQFADGAGPDKRCYRVDCSKIGRVLPAFQPQWNARAGAVQLYHAYKEVGLTLEDLEGPRFMRIRHVKKLHESGHLDSSLRWSNMKRETAQNQTVHA
jgi:nucleoside-diphosphate-sugar epimerase